MGVRHSRVEEPWVNLLKQYGHSTPLCLAPVVKPVRLTWAYHLHEERKPPYLLRRREREVTFRESNHENLSPSPAVPPRAPRRAFPNTSGLTFNYGLLYRLGCCRTSLVGCTIWALLTTDPWELFFGIIKPTYLELIIELCSTFHLQTVMTNYDDPGTVQFCLGVLVCQLSVPEFGAALGLYTEDAASYNLSRSKASVLPPSLRYLHAILTHTITGRRECTVFVNTHDAYFLWCMSHGHVIDLAYFIALAIQHQIEWHRKGSSPLAPMLLDWLDTSGSSASQPKNHPLPSLARCLHKASRACLT
ncbi:hypothetical protein GOBAR_AA35006 [Gossypium barbadense]|uniref:Uncharacterized protein n=1 Tax=Gossypium barbadense TaxID=3634 RepID=A0A2P5W3P9_GOSBA|nr:hypothetical protein GOBAR_AA35006 [Gossypium barbadense]